MAKLFVRIADALGVTTLAVCLLDGAGVLAGAAFALGGGDLDLDAVVDGLRDVAHCEVVVLDSARFPQVCGHTHHFFLYNRALKQFGINGRVTVIPVFP